jgi:DNA polymerase-3 subunit delta'
VSHDVITAHQQLWDKFIALVNKERLAHALLLSGLAGNGKRDFAHQMTCFLLCKQRQNELSACGVCSSCKMLHSASHPNNVVLTNEEGAKFIKIDQIRGLHNLVYQTSSQVKVIQIQPAEQMNLAASNALLKMLEEPPANVLFLLISDNPHRLSATITSRCQHWFFAPPKSEEKGLSTLFLTPGKIAQVKQSSVYQQKEQILSELLGVIKKTQNPVLLAENWTKLPLDELLDLIYVLSTETIKLKHDVTSDALLELPELNDYAASIKISTLFKQLDKMNNIKKRSVNNINPQLALEDLLCTGEE